MKLSDLIEIRKAYSKVSPKLESGMRMSPYAIGIDWITKFSPIENYVWEAIRYLGIPMFPQYPVDRYFIDFADPVRKVGIEVDSIKWHTDKEKDDKRQCELESHGWTIYRIPSWMTRKNGCDYVDNNGDFSPNGYVNDSGEYITNEEYWTDTAEGFLRRLYDR